ncbi:hypothetical protein C8J98_101379 [Luteibacter sp. OK325]|nr:hypothetical protein C8J98_101379 [Luteibacter sp. OK325]
MTISMDGLHMTLGLKLPQLPVEFHTSVTQSQGTTVLDVSRVSWAGIQ